MDYKRAGVNIEAGEEAVNRIKPMVKSTFNSNVLTHIGGFGGLYEVDLSTWKKPVMVASTDGVGTKLIVAQQAGIYGTVGQDLVNHCVNDIFVQGAKPQYFLDYIGVGKLQPLQIEQIISGFCKACRENEISLIGGEMAEMPGIYRPEDFDLCGTIVGLVEKDEIITGEKINIGDIVLGYKSSGLHTNGYSLARKIIFEKMGLKIDSLFPGSDLSVAQLLLEVHTSYLPILKSYAKPGIIHGMAHITGGGIPGNLKRVVPDTLCAFINLESWEVPVLYRTMQEAGKVEELEMYRAFNMGMGFIVVANRENADLLKQKTNALEIGCIDRSFNGQKVELCRFGS